MLNYNDDTESNWMDEGENVTKPDDNRHMSPGRFYPLFVRFCGGGARAECKDFVNFSACGLPLLAKRVE
jgi:hypothetical protein